MSNNKLTLVTFSWFLATMLTFVLVCSGGAAAQSFSVIYNFAPISGDGPSSPLITDSSGNLYGVTLAGGPSGTLCPVGGCGVVYQLVHNSDGAWSENQIYDFGSGSGTDDDANGPIAFDSHGNLYGAAMEGGTDHYGTIYKLISTSGGWTRSVIHNFTGTSDGKFPEGVAVFGDQVYGATAMGGISDGGVVFYLSRVSAMGYYELVAHAFNADSGESPNGWLTFDSSGNIYGTSGFGGPVGDGFVFELMPNYLTFGFKFAHIHDFRGYDGAYPEGFLTMDGNGNLYGVTSLGGLLTSQCARGCGTVFKLTRNPDGSFAYSVLYMFQGPPNDGQGPVGVVIDSAGNLYGETAYGGPALAGTLFKLVPHGASWTETWLHGFMGLDGHAPIGGLLLAPDGNIYGVTAEGGLYQDLGNLGGVAFRITP